MNRPPALADYQARSGSGPAILLFYLFAARAGSALEDPGIFTGQRDVRRIRAATPHGALSQDVQEFFPRTNLYLVLPGHNFSDLPQMIEIMRNPCS